VGGEVSFREGEGSGVEQLESVALGTGFGDDHGGGGEEGRRGGGEEGRRGGGEEGKRS
jgi:hypothetical protein